MTKVVVLMHQNSFGKLNQLFSRWKSLLAGQIGVLLKKFSIHLLIKEDRLHFHILRMQEKNSFDSFWLHNVRN